MAVEGGILENVEYKLADDADDRYFSKLERKLSSRSREETMRLHVNHGGE